MEVELKLPHAENYRFIVSQKTMRKKETDEYVRKLLTEEHPGFNKDSLWDYRIYKTDEKETVIASVLSREFYIEKRVSDSKTVFYVREGNVKLRLFEKSDFDEKGERKKHRNIYLLLFIVIFAAAILIFFTALTNRKNEEIKEDPVQEESISEAVNVFYLSNRFAAVIQEHKGEIKHFQFNAENKDVFVYSLHGCEPYPLVCDLEKKEEGVKCHCEGVIYEGGKESYEIRIEKSGCVLLQKTETQKELLQIQGSITTILTNCDIKLVSAGTDERNGKISFLMECSRQSLKSLNEKLSEICIEDNLFPSVLSEMKMEGTDLFLVKTELICLEDRQKVSACEAEEKLSEIFERDEVKKEDKKMERVSVMQGELEKKRDLKKIGSVKKEGKVYYYYRTADGKIEVSEADYE